MFSKATKQLLRNHIRHTDTHNKILEESEMWRLREERNTRERDTGRRRAHMDEYRGGSSKDSTPEPSGRKRGTYWMKRLHDAEEQDPDRWGHAGYKELHPEEFNSSLSESSDSETMKSKRKKSKKKKRKKEKKSKYKKKRKKEKQSESDNESSEPSVERKAKRKSSKRQRKLSDSCSESDSEQVRTNRSHHKTKRRKSDKDGCDSSSEESSGETKKRQKFMSERVGTRSSPEVTNSKSRSSKHKKKSKHKKRSQSPPENGVVWVEKS